MSSMEGAFDLAVIFGYVRTYWAGGSEEESSCTLHNRYQLKPHILRSWLSSI